MLLVIDVTVSNVVTSEIKDKRRKPLTGVKAYSREVSKSPKYQDLYRAVGMSILPVDFKS